MTSSPSEHSAWTAPGSDTAARNTYASIRTAIDRSAELSGVDVFLQGSYANTTNIRADSDVDVVVQSERTFYSNKDSLSVAAKQRFDAIYSAATYSSSDLRRDVKGALVNYYGVGRVIDKDKCIRVTKRDGYLDADVVPAFLYRHYLSADPADVSSGWVEGIMILPLSGGSIVNFPKEHIKDGQAKNASCGTLYKPTVRQIKRLRIRAVEEGRLQVDEAPGYLLECLTYNVPNSRFVGNDSDRLKDVVLYLKVADKSSFRSCDGIHTLFGTDPGGFTVAAAQRVIDALWDAY